MFTGEIEVEGGGEGSWVKIFNFLHFIFYFPKSLLQGVENLWPILRGVLQAQVAKCVGNPIV